MATWFVLLPLLPSPMLFSLLEACVRTSLVSTRTNAPLQMLLVAPLSTLRAARYPKQHAYQVAALLVLTSSP